MLTTLVPAESHSKHNSKIVGIGEVVELFKAIVYDPEDVEVDLVTVDPIDSTFTREDGKTSLSPLISPVPQ